MSPAALTGGGAFAFPSFPHAYTGRYFVAHLVQNRTVTQTPAHVEATTPAAKLGTTNLKKVFAFVLVSSVMITKLIKDFSVTRAAGFAFHLAENQDLVEAAPAALDEFLDLDPQESQELSDFFAKEFDIPNDQLEQRIERGISLLPEGYSLVKQNLEYYGKVSDYVSEWGSADLAADLPARRETFVSL